MRYEIVVRGYIGDLWFEELTLTRQADFTTVISGSFTDQAALYGALRKISDMGVELVSVNCIEGEKNEYE